MILCAFFGLKGSILEMDFFLLFHFDMISMTSKTLNTRDLFDISQICR